MLASANRTRESALQIVTEARNAYPTNSVSIGDGTRKSFQDVERDWVPAPARNGLVTSPRGGKPRDALHLRSK